MNAARWNKTTLDEIRRRLNLPAELLNETPQTNYSSARADYEKWRLDKS